MDKQQDSKKLKYINGIPYLRSIDVATEASKPSRWERWLFIFSGWFGVVMSLLFVFAMIFLVVYGF